MSVVDFVLLYFHNVGHFTLVSSPITLQTNVSLTTNYSDQKLLVILVTNLNTNLQNKNY